MDCDEDSPPYDECAAMAEIIIKRLLHHAEGNVRRPTAWRRVAKKLGIAVKEYYSPGTQRGCYTPPLDLDDTDFGGCIAVNTAYPKEDQARTWIHEFTHLYLFAWTPAIMGSETGSERSGHIVAVMVTTMIMDYKPTNLK